METKVYDGPGKGRKQCTACKIYVAARVKVCNCGHEFITARKKTVEVAAAAPVVEPVVAEEPKPGRQTSYPYVYAPAGKPPCKPTLPATDDDIVNWVKAIREAGYNEKFEYGPEAVCYFAQSFWDVNGPEYSRVKAVILGQFVDKDYEYERSDIGVTQAQKPEPSKANNAEVLDIDEMPSDEDQF